MKKTTLKLPEKTKYVYQCRGKGNNIPIKSTSGEKTFTTERNLFPEFFSIDFEDHRTNVPSLPTKELVPVIYKQRRDGGIRKIFYPLIKHSWTSQHPIIYFIQHSDKWLYPNETDSMFFPFVVGSKNFVAWIRRRHSRSELRAELILPMENMRRLDTRYKHLFILPQPIQPNP